MLTRSEAGRKGALSRWKGHGKTVRGDKAYEKEYRRKYYLEHKDKWVGRKNKKQYNHKYKYVYRPYSEKYKDIKVLERKRFTNMRYKARKQKAEGSHTFEEWLRLKKEYNNMCLCCKQFEPTIKLTEDHIIPLSMGGSDLIENIQPLCQLCNTRKHAKYISYLPIESNSFAVS